MQGPSACAVCSYHVETPALQGDQAVLLHPSAGAKSAFQKWAGNTGLLKLRGLSHARVEHGLEAQMGTDARLEAEA